MSQDINVFGKPATAATASTIMNSPVLNANPSPNTPQEAPSNTLIINWARILYAAYDVRRAEKDPQRMTEISDIIQKAERAYSELAIRNDDEIVDIPKPPQTMPPPGAPPMQAAGVAAPPPPQPMNPGVPPGPPVPSGPPPQ